ncbi:MAG: AmmeMemoRadiSam system protein B [Deltaproteobacteria bacterium]|jgi:AmmeMemoRadiSam system protein B|nr:AmmeMemoRadiSam system protein B [Deltaproteobacteria bacterium]
MTGAKTRKTELAGTWYPATAKAAVEAIDSWRPYIELSSGQGSVLCAIIPHAGWYFSGRLAARAILEASQSFGPQGPELVVVLGGHLPLDGEIVAFGEKAWETPFGPLELDFSLNDLLIGKLSPLIWKGGTHDNTIEVQMPLVKNFCPKAKAWALRVPPGEKALLLGQVLVNLAQNRPGGVLILASTDLTHYGEAYGFAPAGRGIEGKNYQKNNDLAFIKVALEPNPSAMMFIGENKRAACSSGAAAAAATAANLLKTKARLIDHYCSSDILPGEQSVGYAAILYALTN